MTDKKKKYYAIVLAAFNAIVSLCALFVDGDYVQIKILSLFSFFFFTSICILESHNVLFLARTFILGFIGYFPMIIKVTLGEEALFSGYEPSTQGFNIVVLMYVATSFALFSNQIGLALAKKRKLVTSDKNLEPVDVRVGKNRKTGLSYWWLAGVIGIILVFFSSYMHIRGYGKPVFVVGYGGDEQAKGLPFGSIAVFGSVGILSLFVAGAKGYVKNWKIKLVIACFMFVVYSQLFMGLRQDAMSSLFGLLVLYGVVNRREIGLKLSHIPFFVAGYVFFEAWGLARDLIWRGIPFTTIIMSAFTGIGATDAVRWGTISPIATTFSNTVWLIESKIISYSLGQSYWEWILRIPPEFLFPSRPRDYALMFAEYGLDSGGGFFELAEVYMNFGLLGALIIPGIISFLLAKSYYYAFYRQSMLSYFFLFSFLAMFLRGTWYQTFAFFRVFLACMMLYFLYIFAIQILLKYPGKGGDQTLGETN